LQIETGNAGKLDTQGTGWFLGFSDWTRYGENGAGGLRYMPVDCRSHGLCMKWMVHPAGDPRGTDKPVSEGRTMSILIGSGRFRIAFSESKDFSPGATREIVLSDPGDFVAWGAGIYHRYAVDVECTVLTLRWIPDGNWHVRDACVSTALPAEPEASGVSAKSEVFSAAHTRRTPREG
jgi:hypothetical protein